MKGVLTIFMVKVSISGQTKLEVQLEICHSILDSQVKRGLTFTTAPDVHHLLEAAEEESLLCHHAAGGGLRDERCNNFNFSCPWLKLIKV